MSKKQSRSGKTYIIEEIEGMGKLGDYTRRLFYITEEGAGKSHYKGMRVSRTDLSTSGKTIDQLFDQIYEIIEAELDNDNVESFELDMHSNSKLLNEIGEYK